MGQELEQIPKEYINYIQNKNISSFFSDLNKMELYSPKIKYIIDNQYYYFEDCTLLNLKLAEYLSRYAQSQELTKILESSSVQFSMFQQKLFLHHNWTFG